jgi:hypothetical protein
MKPAAPGRKKWSTGFPPEPFAGPTLINALCRLPRGSARRRRLSREFRTGLMPACGRQRRSAALAERPARAA